MHDQRMPDRIRILRLTPEATLPTRTHADDAGMDLYSLEDVRIAPREGQVLRTGIAMAIPTGFVGLIADRSSMAKRGLKIAGGIVDAGYRGEVHIVIWNIGSETSELKRGERIAQMLIVPIATPRVEEVRELDQTARGDKGFGSSGR